MRKLTCLAVMVSLVLVIGCKVGGKYGDVKDVMNKMITAMEGFTAAVDKAKSGKEVADALVKFNKETEGLKVTMKELDKKYPELKKDKTPPPELKEIADKVEATGKKMGESMGKVMKTYMQDPDVQAAFKAMSKQAP